MSEETIETHSKSKIKEPVWQPFIKLLFKAKLPWVWIIVLIIITLGESQLALIFPDLTSKIAGGHIEKPIVFGAIGVIVARIIISGIMRFVAKLTMFKIDKSYRELIWEQLMRSPIGLFDKVKANEMVSRTSTDTASLSIIFSYVVPTLLSMIYLTIGTVSKLFGYDWRLGLAQVIFIPLYFGFYLWYGRWSFRVNKQVQNRLATLTQFLSELLVNIPLIKTFVTEKKEEKRGIENIDLYYKVSIKKGIVNWIEHPMTGIFGVVQSALVIGLGVLLISNGSITVETWVAYFLYVDLLYGVLGTFGYLFIELKQSQGASARIAQLVENPIEIYQRKQSLEQFNEDLVLDKVSFSYEDEKVLSNVSFTIPHGKVTAIVGPSGGGKTTILSLIERFYEVETGSIKLGKTAIEDYHLDEWRRAFGYVAQDIPLLTGTIRENLVYGVEREVSDQELREVAHQANALSFIEQLPEGFDTHIGENGGKLSGGQRQRIAIARVILRDPQVLLLDEATSNLDSRSEQAVLEAMNHLMRKGRTTIVIAHDLTTIRNADQIVVLDEGTVSGIGEHKVLLETNQLYRKYIDLQLGKPIM